MIRWKAVALLAAGAVAMVVVFVVATRSAPTSSSSQQAAGRASARPAATSTPAPTVAPAIQEARQVAIRFTSVYLSYDWQHPPDIGGELKPLTTERLFDSLVYDGVTPDGVGVPWASVRPDLHERDQATVVSVDSQAPGTDQVAVQLRVYELLTTDAGHSEIHQEVDLSLQRADIWRVDWVTVRGERQ